jgi:ERCC4-type nuclease
VHLSEYSDRKGRDVTEWTWEEMSYRHHPLADDGEQTRSEEGVELADGTVVTSDVSDVEATPAPASPTETDSSEQPAGESEDESTVKPADEVIEETTADEGQSDGLASRLKQSVTGGKDTDADTDDEEHSLTALGAVTARTAGDLQDAGFESVEQVYTADRSALVEVDGFDERKADTIQAEAGEALGIAEDEPDSESAGTDTGSESDAETDAAVDVEAGESSDESATEQETDKSDTDKPTVEVEFTPGEETADNESEADADPDPDTETSESDESAGIAGRIKDSLDSMFPHPAAGKSQPDLTDIGGVVDEQKAAVLRNAGFESVEQVYTADKSALAEVQTIDETQAGYIQNGAEQALDASDAPLPENADQPESESDTEDENEDAGSPDQPAEDGEGSDENPQPPESSLDAESADADDAAVESNGDEPALPALTDIQEVGDDRADDLRAEGYESVEDVAAVGQTTLTEVGGIGDARAKKIAASASDLLDEQPEGAVADAPGDDD